MFVPERPFQRGLMFAGKAGACLSVMGLSGAFFDSQTLELG
jgi:hypothetical protein